MQHDNKGSNLFYVSKKCNVLRQIKEMDRELLLIVSGRFREGLKIQKKLTYVRLQHHRIFFI